MQSGISRATTPRTSEEAPITFRISNLSCALNRAMSSKWQQAQPMRHIDELRSEVCDALPKYEPRA